MQRNLHLMTKSWDLFTMLQCLNFVSKPLCVVYNAAGAKNGHFGQLFAFHEREVNPPQFGRQSTMDSK